jgi:hypothetical protein
MWIFKSHWQDFIKLYLPGILGVLLLEFLNPGDEVPVAFYFFVFYFLDAGHVYTTLWRTMFNPTEFKREPLTWQVPLVILLLTTIWLLLKIPYFWSFVVYYTFYHNLRQGWGIIRWYEKINQRFDRNELIYYALTVIPLIMFHFRVLPFKVTYYSETDFFFNPQLEPFSLDIGMMTLTFYNWVYFSLLLLYLGVWLGWMGREIATYRKNHSWELNRLLAMVYFFAVYAYSFIFSNTTVEVLAILILSHGFPYIFIMSKHLTNKEWSLKKVLLALGILLFFGTSVNYVLEEYYLTQIFYYTKTDPPWWEYLVAILYIVPTLSHFTWDIYLWKRIHPDVGNLYE